MSTGRSCHLVNAGRLPVPETRAWQAVRRAELGRDATRLGVMAEARGGAFAKALAQLAPETT